jgi:cytochrome c biogenesis protein CcmG, thiol:disulfide interchange protein DsbE
VTKVSIITVVRREKRRLAAGVLLVVAYLVISRMAARRGGSVMTLPKPQDRVPFTVDFTLPDVQGKVVRLSDLRGRPVLINLWATWCYPCREEMPSMNALYTDYHAKGLVIVAIAMDAGGKPVVSPFMQAYGLTFPVLLDPQNMLGVRLQVSGIPTSYLLDKWGRIIGIETGARDWNTRKIRRLVEQLLAEEGGGTTP